MQRGPLFCPTDQFEQLLSRLKEAGYKLLGPTVRDEVIIYDELHTAQDLPIGWTDEQDPGRYRLKRRADNAYFGYNVGPHSWKQFLFPPKEKLWTAKRQANNKLVVLQETVPPDEKMAFIGVRACEIQGLFVLDKVFNTAQAVYQQYQQRRENTFILAVNCTSVVNTCFCASMNSGPHVKEGYDLSLTEVVDEAQHYFLLVVGSEKAQALCRDLNLRAATRTEQELAYARVQQTVDQMVRKVDNGRVPEVLRNTLGSKQWDKVAERCINCANCTLACPTCFCSDTEEVVSVDGAQVDRWQHWESCFNLSHSYLHSGTVRSSASSRYRQWLTHKFGTWWDQFGVSGCIGCGRCITWCPVGIDVTEELQQLQEEYDKPC